MKNTWWKKKKHPPSGVGIGYHKDPLTGLYHATVGDTEVKATSLMGLREAIRQERIRQGEGQ